MKGEKTKNGSYSTVKKPLELFNVAKDLKYLHAFKKMKQLLEEKMLEIGDIPSH